MAQQFVRIGETRLRVSTIKKYLPYGKNKINVYFNTSRNKIEVETFEFNDELLRINMIEKLDVIFGL
jgi:hypothetical protein